MLSTPDGDYKVKIENPEIEWDGWRNPLGVSAVNVQVINKGTTVSYFPKIILKIYLHKLLFGVLDVKSLELDHPSATLMQNDDGSISLGLNNDNAQENSSIPSIVQLLVSEDANNPIKHLKSVIIRHATLSVKNKSAGVLIQSNDASIEMTKHKGKIKGVFVMPIVFDNEPANIYADFNLDKKNDVDGARIMFKNIHTSALHALFPNQAWMNGVNLPVSGMVQVSSDFSGNINNLDYMVEIGAGNISYPPLFDSTIRLQAARLSGNVTDKLSTYNISKGKVTVISSESKPVDLQFHGTITKTGDDYGLDAYGETANAPVNDVHVLWPLILSPPARNWVKANMSNGMVSKANFTLHFNPGELKLKNVPEEALAASINIKGATIKYLPGHPPVDDVNGVIKFTGRSMDAKISSAKYMSGTVMSQMDVKMPDLYPDDVKMLIDMNVNAPARDVTEFMTFPKVEVAKKLGVTKDATGQLDANIKLSFIAFSIADASKQGNDFRYNIDGNINNVSQNNFLGNLDIAGANMKMQVDNKNIKLNGDATINNVPMKVDLTSSFEKDHETDYTVKCTMPANMIQGFGMPPLDFATGTIGVNASFAESDTIDHSKASLDLTNLSISLPKYGFAKKTGDKASLDMTTEKMPSGNTVIRSFLLKGDNLLASGSGEYSKADNTVSAMKFDRLQIGNTDLSTLDYQNTKDTIKLVASGSAFDLSPFLKDKKNTGKGGYNVNINVNRLIFGDKKEMKSAVITADCSDICHSVNMSALLADGTPFNYAINAGNVSANTNNAGELIRVLDISDTVTGGKLRLTGKYADNKIEGILSIKDYTLKKAPILTKILTIASLTGFLDTLTGNGISFQKLTAPFTYKDGLIALKDAKAHGSAIGITADGTIDTTNSTLDLQGVLIPSYTMNSLIGNVPVIGDLLMGGHGKGIFAINYSVKGSTSDPSIHVNPLSVLTPGFLRGIFDVFDEPAPDFDKIAAERKKEEDMKRDPSLPSMDTLKNPTQPTPTP